MHLQRLRSCFDCIRGCPASPTGILFSAIHEGGWSQGCSGGAHSVLLSLPALGGHSSLCACRRMSSGVLSSTSPGSSFTRGCSWGNSPVFEPDEVQPAPGSSSSHSNACQHASPLGSSIGAMAKQQSTGPRFSLEAAQEHAARAEAGAGGARGAPGVDPITPPPGASWQLGRRSSSFTTPELLGCSATR